MALGFCSDMTVIDHPSRVLVENEWYDGPRSGVTEILGQPYRFNSLFDEETGFLDTFLIWPIPADEVALEVEQWHIFVAWNRKYEAGELDTATHPGHGGIDERWDLLERMLAPIRRNIPEVASYATAETVPLKRNDRYSEVGPNYAIRWLFK
jgi:hypothetical protein